MKTQFYCTLVGNTTVFFPLISVFSTTNGNMIYPHKGIFGIWLKNTHVGGANSSSPFSKTKKLKPQSKTVAAATPSPSFSSLFFSPSSSLLSLAIFTFIWIMATLAPSSDTASKYPFSSLYLTHVSVFFVKKKLVLVSVSFSYALCF